MAQILESLLYICALNLKGHCIKLLAFVLGQGIFLPEYGIWKKIKNKKYRGTTAINDDFTQ